MAKKTGELRGMGSLPVGGSRGGQRGMKGSLTVLLSHTQCMMSA